MSLLCGELYCARIIEHVLIDRKIQICDVVGLIRVSCVVRCRVWWLLLGLGLCLLGFFLGLFDNDVFSDQS